MGISKERIKALWADPNYRLLQAIRRKESWQNPERKQQAADRMQERMANPDYSKMMGNITRENWKNPVWKEQNIASHKETFSTPEYHVKASQARREVWAKRSLEVRRSILAPSHINRPSHTEKAKRIMAFKHWKGGAKASNIRHTAHRRELGSDMLNMPMAGLEAHHIDKIHILNISAGLHQRVKHRLTDKASMDRINALAFASILGKNYD